jgi:hypothetical protein
MNKSTIYKWEFSHEFITSCVLGFPFEDYSDSDDQSREELIHEWLIKGVNDGIGHQVVSTMDQVNDLCSLDSHLQKSVKSMKTLLHARLQTEIVASIEGAPQQYVELIKTEASQLHDTFREHQKTVDAASKEFKKKLLDSNAKVDEKLADISNWTKVAKLSFDSLPPEEKLSLFAIPKTDKDKRKSLRKRIILRWKKQLYGQLVENNGYFSDPSWQEIVNYRGQ